MAHKEPITSDNNERQMTMLKRWNPGRAGPKKVAQYTRLALLSSAFRRAGGPPGEPSFGRDR